MSKIIKIGLLQYLAGDTLEENQEIGELACREAKDKGVDIVLFPEIWSHGYEFYDDKTSIEAWKNSAISDDSDFVNKYKKLAIELQIAISVSYLGKNAEAAPSNRMILIDSNGDIVLTYDKVHICLHTKEKECSPGNEFKVVSLKTKVGEVKVGAMICYDREFSESARVLALKGAELVLIPNACVFDDNRVEQLKTRALDNKIAIAMTNYPNNHRAANGRSLGISAVSYAPAGSDKQSTPCNSILLEAGKGEGVFTFDIDLDELRNYQENAIWGAPHRRPDAYSIMVEPNASTFNPTKIVQ